MRADLTHGPTQQYIGDLAADTNDDDYYEYDGHDDDLTPGQNQQYVGGLAAADYNDEDLRMFPEEEKNAYFIVVGGRI